MSEEQVSTIDSHGDGAHNSGHSQGTKSEVARCHEWSAIVDDYVRNGDGHVCNRYGCR